MLDHPASSLIDGSKDVAAAGTAEKLSTDNQRILGVTIHANADNTGDIYIGGPTVAAGRGIVLDGGESVSIPVAQLSAVYVDAGTTGDGVTFAATRP